ncbi:hypothetical protein WJX77_006066 [Trebouxia sp. C0004]
MLLIASSVLDEPAGDGSDTQIQSKLAAATVAALAEVPAVGATAGRESVAPAIVFGQEWSNEDMAAARAKIAELEAATVQLKADNAGLEASVRMKDTALGDVSAMSLKAQGLPNGGAVGPAAASPLVSQSGHKRSHDGNGTAHARGKKLKGKDFSKRAGSNSGGKGKISVKSFRPDGAIDLTEILPLPPELEPARLLKSFPFSFLPLA